MAEHNVDVRLLTPEGEVFNGEVEQLSTRTAVGEIGILANHVPVLARLLPTELRLHMPERRGAPLGPGRGLAAGVRQPRHGPCRRGDPAREPRPGELRSRIEDADARLSESEEGSGAHQQAQRDKARAEAFLAVAGRGELAPRATALHRALSRCTYDPRMDELALASG